MIKHNIVFGVFDGMGGSQCGGAAAMLAAQNAEKIDIKNMSMTQLVLKINNVIEKHIASELRKDGGDIELVDVKDNKIFVSLKGMCKSCKFSSNTLKNFVEASLKEHISPDIEVVEV